MDNRILIYLGSVFLIILFFTRPKTKSLNSRGQELVDNLLELEGDLSIGRSFGITNPPKYKFYTELIDTVLNYSRVYGAPVRKVLELLRNEIIKDLQFERKLSKEIQGAVAQFVMTAGITWVFIGIGHSVMRMGLNWPILYSIGLLEAGGLILFFVLYRWGKRRAFWGFGPFFKSLYVFDSLYKVGVPMNVLLSESSIGELINRSDALFKKTQARLSRMLEGLGEKGVPIQADLDRIIGEIHFLQEQKFEDFHKLMAILKFLILVCFFLSSYLIYLFSLLDSFLVSIG